MNLNIKRLSPPELSGFITLIRIFEVVFEKENFVLPETEHLQGLLNKDDFWAIVAEADGEVVGGLTVYVLEQYYATRPLAYIYDLGVAPAFQGKGIGNKLIAFLTDYCKEHRIEAAFVQADAEDLDAIRFYRKTAISSELQAIHFTYDIP